MHFTYHRKKYKVVLVWPGAAHAPIGVKLNPQVYSVQQQIPAKFHPEIGRQLGEWRPKNLSSFISSILVLDETEREADIKHVTLL